MRFLLVMTKLTKGERSAPGVANGKEHDLKRIIYSKPYSIELMKVEYATNK